MVRPRIIYLAPMGDGDREHLEGSAEGVREQFGLDVKIGENQGLPAYAFNEARNQYNSNMILKRLLETSPSDALKIVGVTNVDLFSPIFSYVFGEAQFGGKGAVVSTFRLGPGLDDEPRGGCPSLANRLEKEIMHELGHTFTLRHCSDPDCVMHYSTGVQCADRKFAFFCSACRDLMLWNMAAQLFLKP